MSPLPVVGSGSSTGVNATYLNQLIQASMAMAARPLTLLNNQRDSLEVTIAVYTDLSTKLSTFNTVIQDLLLDSSESDDTSVFQGKTVTSSDTTAVSASVNSDAGVGTYDISVTTLAQSHRVHSEQQTYSDQALGLSGTFVVGGAASRSVSNEATVADTVTDFDVAAIAIDQQELGSGSYYVEVRDNDGTDEFRIVDADGEAVSVADASSGEGYTSSWQDIADVAGTAFDTGRGLSVTFGNGPYTAGTKGSGAASVDYTAQGQSVTVDATMTLDDIRDDIRDGTYAEGMDVQAIIVDKQLVLTRTDMGSGSNVIAADVSGTVLSGSGAAGLGILGDGGAGDVDGTDGFKVTLQIAESAQFDVNGISVTRDSNTALTDVVDGLTLNLLEEGGSADLEVAVDSDTIVGKFYGLQTQFNQISGYLKAKTEVTENSDGTYSRGTLSGDLIFTSLRYQLINDLNSRPDGLSATAPKSLDEIGITFDDELNLVINDSDLVDALASDFDGVFEMVNAVVQQISDRMETYLDTDGIVQTSSDSYEGQMERLDDRISDMNQRLEDQEEVLTERYARLMIQLAQMQNTSSSVLAMLGTGYTA